jgi:transcription initiation factor TFIIF subunit beta
MVNETVENQIVVAERPKDTSLSVHGTNAPFNSRARTTILTGRIKHECNLRPSFSESYRKQMRERHRKYNTKQRQIKMIEDAKVSGGRGGINRLSSGVGVGSGGAFSDLVVSTIFSARP